MADNSSGSSNVLVFIIGGLVVAVAVIGWFVYNGGMFSRGAMPGPADTNITIESTSKSEAPAAPAAPST